MTALSGQQPVRRILSRVTIPLGRLHASASPIKDSSAELTLFSMGPFYSEPEDLYRRRHGAFQVMLASVTGSVQSARDVVQEAFAQALRDQNGFRGAGSLEELGVADRVPGRRRFKGSHELAVD